MPDDSVQPAPVPNQPMIPQTAQGVMSPQQPQQPQPSPQQMQTQHSSRLGALAKSLLGKQYDYQVDPKTGQTVQTPRQQAPGELFRHLVAGALLGGAAEAEHPSGTGFLGGAAVGGSAAMKADQQQDELRRSHAQEQFKNQQETQKMGMEQQRLDIEKNRFQQEGIFQKAQIANWTAAQLRADKEADFQTEKFMQEQNQYNTNIQLELGKMGASLAPIVVGGKNINGTPDNGGDIQKYFSDPKNSQAPTGFSFLPVQTVDTNGLHRDAKTNQWMDEKGNDVSLNDRTTWKVYSVPQNTLSQPIAVKGSTINKLTGSDLPADSNYNMPITDYIGLNTQKHTRDLQDAKENRDNERLQNTASYDAAKASISSANDQLRAAQALGDTAGIATATEKLNAATEEMQRVADLINPKAAKAREAAAKAKGEKPKTDIDALRSKAPWASIKPGYVAVFDTEGNFKGQALPGRAPTGTIEVPQKAAAPLTSAQQKEAEDIQDSQPTP